MVPFGALEVWAPYRGLNRELIVHFAYLLCITGNGSNAQVEECGAALKELRVDVELEVDDGV